MAGLTASQRHPTNLLYNVSKFQQKSGVTETFAYVATKIYF